MSCYFIIEVYINNNSNTSLYDEYIEEVKPIVESYGGKYIIRSNNIFSLHPMLNPSRVIIIEFPSKEKYTSKFYTYDKKEKDNLML